MTQPGRRTARSVLPKGPSCLLQLCSLSRALWRFLLLSDGGSSDAAKHGVQHPARAVHLIPLASYMLNQLRCQAEAILQHPTLRAAPQAHQPCEMAVYPMPDLGGHRPSPQWFCPWRRRRCTERSASTPKL
eukprot:7432655-Alexandrium_andersonii.AAC.1